MDRLTRLSLIRSLGIARGMVVALPGLLTVSRAEINSEANNLSAYQADHYASATPSTSDDSAELVDSHPDALADAAARRLGYDNE